MAVYEPTELCINYKLDHCMTGKKAKEDKG